MARIIPRLAYSHPGYAAVTLVLMMVHLSAWSDGVFGGQDRHAAPVFDVFDDLGGMALWGWMHLAVAAAMVVGLYGPFAAARVGFAFSAAVYTSTSVAYATSAVTQPAASWLGACYAAAFAGISWAAMTEPEVNPASARRPPNEA